MRRNANSNATQCNAVQRSATQCNATQRDAMHHGQGTEGGPPPLHTHTHHTPPHPPLKGSGGGDLSFPTSSPPLLAHFLPEYPGLRRERKIAKNSIALRCSAIKAHCIAVALQ